MSKRTENDETLYFLDGILRSELKDIKAEIQALPVTYPFYNHIEPFVCLKDVTNILDKHISGKESEE